MRTAVLFDVDGTLVDSNYLHVQAWREAFRAGGVEVDDWRIHRAIGMDGERLLDTLAPHADTSTREQISDVHSRAYADVSDQLRRFDGVPELLQDIHDRGCAIVLATSSNPSELSRLTDVLACPELVDAMTNADDVAVAKPEPDLVLAALDKVDVAPRHAVLVGDAVWDGHAAGRAGVRFVGVRTGGVDAASLLDAGAEEVYEEVAVLHAMLASSPIADLLG